MKNLIDYLKDLKSEKQFEIFEEEVEYNIIHTVVRLKDALFLKRNTSYAVRPQEKYGHKDMLIVIRRFYKDCIHIDYDIYKVDNFTLTNKEAITTYGDVEVIDMDKLLQTRKKVASQINAEINELDIIGNSPEFNKLWN